MRKKLEGFGEKVDEFLEKLECGIFFLL